ncbi:MAG: right-handed parallel beta-helix repeat-containing protein [Bacteroidia bacterium]|nr:right-handed parallel beta-helix repeat-containing protein [Bacteroidia bacterium]
MLPWYAHVFPLILHACMPSVWNPQAESRTIFVSPSGDDAFPGTRERPIRSLARLQALPLGPGVQIRFEGGQRFEGTLRIDSAARGSEAQPLRIGAYGEGRAILDGGHGPAVVLSGTAHVQIRDLVLRGAGLDSGNTASGLIISQSQHVEVSDLEACGFQRAGVLIESAQHVTLRRVHAHRNGGAGIEAAGLQYPLRDNYALTLTGCRAERNPGNPAVRDNHSGNGIVVGLARQVLIDSCVAAENGGSMPWRGNGPVGIWVWECDSVVIQHCIAYRNRTAPGARDGGGFDLDGGVTYSIVQYNLSWENEGAGFGIFQYPGATPWHSNAFRYNVSIDDGHTAPDGAGIAWWNGDRDSSTFRRCWIHNNLIINRRAPALAYVSGSYHSSGFVFFRNIFQTAGPLLMPPELHGERFAGNVWGTADGGFRIGRYRTAEAWAKAAGQEWQDGRFAGQQASLYPELPAGWQITDPAQLHTLPLRTAALLPLYGDAPDYSAVLPPAAADFFGRPLPPDAARRPGIGP